MTEAAGNTKRNRNRKEDAVCRVVKDKIMISLSCQMSTQINKVSSVILWFLIEPLAMNQRQKAEK